MNTNPEDRRRSPGRSGSSWLATLAGALVLVALGFGVGLVAGTAYEEPGLVAEHLGGGSLEVALAPSEPTPPDFGAQDVAAAPPLAEAVEDVEPPAPLGSGALEEERTAVATARVAAPAAAAAPTKAPVTPGAADAAFSIQVGAFGSERAARDLAAQLSRHGFPSQVAEEGAGARFKVRVGPLASRGAAEQTAERLRREQRLPTWIVTTGAAHARAD